MKYLTYNPLAALCLTVGLAISGCTAPAGTPSFWTQKVLLNAVGLNIVTEFGLINAGTITWSRNVDNPPEVEKLSGALKAGK